MNNTITMPPKSPPKTVSLHLNEEIDQWLEEQAIRRDLSKARFAREVFQKAMRESEPTRTREVA